MAALSATAVVVAAPALVLLLLLLLCVLILLLVRVPFLLLMFLLACVFCHWCSHFGFAVSVAAVATVPAEPIAGADEFSVAAASQGCCFLCGAALPVAADITLVSAALVLAAPPVTVVTAILAVLGLLIG